jgi:iron-sulfur cluster assembly protein
VLTISSEAAEAIRGLVAAPELPDGAMVRIESDPTEGLQIGLVDAPSPGDEVVEGEGIEVAVDPETASLLDDKFLDAAVEEDEITFTVTDQASRNGRPPDEVIPKP